VNGELTSTLIIFTLLPSFVLVLGGQAVRRYQGICYSSGTDLLLFQLGFCLMVLWQHETFAPLVRTEIAGNVPGVYGSTLAITAFLWWTLTITQDCELATMWNVRKRAYGDPQKARRALGTCWTTVLLLFVAHFLFFV
jgi:hypothetical protein